MASIASNPAGREPEMRKFIEEWEDRIGCRWPFLVALCLTVAYVAEGSL